MNGLYSIHRGRNAPDLLFFVFAVLLGDVR